MVTRWTLLDAVAAPDETFTFPFNPNTVTGPDFEKTITWTATAAPDGKNVAWEGRDAPQTINFEGTIYSAQQHEDFITWWAKRNQVTLTNDYGDTLVIYLTKYKPKRERKSAINPQRRTYTFEAIVLDWS